MVDLAQLSQRDSYAQTSGPGFGTRMLCRPLDEHNTAPTDVSMWLTGLRRANALSTNTNPIPNSHMRSPGGFMEFFAGLRDPGDIQFEACWKNDVPRGDAVVAGSKAKASLDFQRWQAPSEADLEAGVDSEGFFHSLFYDRQPFEAWVIPPQWTRGLIIVRGYASMVGPYPHEMEGVINFQGSFKASGKPMILRGERIAFGSVAVSATDDSPLRFRAVKDNFLEENWTNAASSTQAIAWGDGHPAPAMDDGFKYYKYTEDKGFGEAF